MGPVMAEEAQNSQNTGVFRNGAGCPATQNTAANNNGATCPSPTTSVTTIPNGTIATKVHCDVWYKYERSVRIHINGLVSERDFAIWIPFGDVINRRSDRYHKYCLSVCRSGLRVPIAYSLLGGGVPIPEQRLYWTLDSVP